jgi:hypothetical protein
MKEVDEMKREYIVKCKHCKKGHKIEAFHEDMQKWYSGTIIQAAMPYLNADERELLISQICPPCWEKYYF